MDSNTIDSDIVARFLQRYYAGTTGRAFEAKIRALKELRGMPNREQLILKNAFQRCLQADMPERELARFVSANGRKVENDADARAFLQQVYDDCALDFAYDRDDYVD